MSDIITPVPTKLIDPMDHDQSNKMKNGGNPVEMMTVITRSTVQESVTSFEIN